MRKKWMLALAVVSLIIVGPAVAQQKKVKSSKVTGDVGLLDMEKNYMIVVTKEGKLITVDFNDKTKVTKYVPQGAKMGDIGLGANATVTYKKQGDKNVIDAIEIKMKAKSGE